MSPSFDSICAAAKTIKGHAVETPLLESPALNKKLGGRLFIKAEMLQKTGSFKFRGAFNALSNLSDAQRAKGAQGNIFLVVMSWRDADQPFGVSQQSASEKSPEQPRRKLVTVLKRGYPFRNGMPGAV